MIASKIGIKTVAEFVFDEETAEKAGAIGCDYLQGFHYAEPLQTIPAERQSATSTDKRRRSFVLLLWRHTAPCLPAHRAHQEKDYLLDDRDKHRPNW